MLSSEVMPALQWNEPVEIIAIDVFVGVAVVVLYGSFYCTAINFHNFLCVDFSSYPFVRAAYIKWFWYRLHLLRLKRIALLQFNSWQFPRSLFKFVDCFSFSIVLSPWCWELQSQWIISQFPRAWSSAERKCLTGHCSNTQNWFIRFRFAKKNFSRAAPFSVPWFVVVTQPRRETA